MEKGGLATVQESIEQPGVLYKRLDFIWLASVRTDRYTEQQFYDEVGHHLGLLQNPAYDIARFLPQTDLTWSPDARRNGAGYIVMDRVNGTPLSQVLDIDPLMAAQVDTLLAELVRLATDYSDDLNQPQFRVLPDVVNTEQGGFMNLMIGTTETNPIAQPYLIDPYPAVAWTGLTSAEPLWRQALDQLQTQSPGYSFDQTRAALDNFFYPRPDQ